ncbi:MAG: DUF916 domain-containing protein [Bifidobacteriaceae bacterium]|jgi:hypothetical protein|nr:DUF916 domain-containing protein [Bifidobacteriaceae bacterium]
MVNGRLRAVLPATVMGAWLALALAITPLLPPAFAADADQDDSKTSFTVAPADEQGKDGRHWFELGLDPGETVAEHLAVKNLSSHAVVFGLSAADGYFNKNGRYGMLTDPSKSVDAGLWVRVQPTVEVAAGETVVVPFTVTAPANTEPGDHPAGIAASVSGAAGSGSPGDGATGGGSGMGVTSRVGVRVMVRVGGELAPALEIHHAEASYAMSWNPLKPGQLASSFDVVNTGNTRLDVTGLVAAGDGETAWPEGDGKIELLPGGAWHVETTVGGAWPWFHATATIRADPVVVVTASDDPPPIMEPVIAKAGAVALPLPHVFVLFALVLIVVAVVAGRKKSKRRVEDMIDRAVQRARAETRRELAGGEGWIGVDQDAGVDLAAEGDRDSRIDVGARVDRDAESGGRATRDEVAAPDQAAARGGPAPVTRRKLREDRDGAAP